MTNYSAGTADRIEAAVARHHAEALVAQLAPLCQRIEIAGSLRRGKADLKDVELVALPIDSKALLARLDNWVIAGKIRKAIYPDGSQRWGSKYRGFTYESIRFELFTADADNWGYQLWLRTGPADANEYVMRQCISYQSPYHARDGYWWAGDARLSVPDEVELFRLLGMPPLHPVYRTLERYQQLLSPPQWASEWTVAESVDDAQQMNLL